MKAIEIINKGEENGSRRLIPVHTWARFSQRPEPFCREVFVEKMDAAIRQCVLALPATSADDVWCADDSIMWFRTMGFLKDPAFMAAHQPYRGHDYLRARLWRTYTEAWAIRSCLGLGGAIVDVGCYNGVADDVLYRYIGAPADTVAWYLYDVFHDPPNGRRKWAHSLELEAEVRQRFADRPNVSICAGLLPMTLAVRPERIGCLLVDLNDPILELAVLEQLYDSIVPGGIVIVDDYGDNEYRASQGIYRAFFESRGQFIYESPTSQGIVIKR